MLTFGGVNTQPTLTTCDPNRWDQKISMESVGRLRNAYGLCLAVQDNVPYAFNSGTKIRMASCAATDISRNGVRLTTDRRVTQSPFWEYHFR